MAGRRESIWGEHANPDEEGEGEGGFGGEGVPWSGQPRTRPVEGRSSWVQGEGVPPSVPRPPRFWLGKW